MPRYLDLAAALQRQIASGESGVGAQLPTEHELCATHGVSRHTARAALKVLEDQGLIQRRPGLGTRVVATSAVAPFTQPLGGIDALLQYAHEARLSIVSTRQDLLSAADARRLGAPKGGAWLRLDGVRSAKGAPVAATTIRVARWIGARPADLADALLAVTEQIERRFGVSADRITQRIEAGRLSEEDAGALGARAGEPSLVTVRRYFDAADRLFVVSESRHPAGRFAYEMTYTREKPRRAPAR